MSKRAEKNFGARFTQAQERFLFDRGERPQFTIVQSNPQHQLRIALIGGLFLLLAAYISKK